MKKIIIVALLLLLCIGLIGSFSTLGNTSGGGAGESSTKEDDSEEFPEDGVYEVAENLTFYNSHYSVGGSDIQALVASYFQGECIVGDTDQIYLGYAEKLDQRLIAVSFDGLEIGKSYLIHFIRHDDYPIDFDQLYYRFGTSGSFYDFSFSPSDDTYSFIITPTVTTFQLGILFFDEAPSSQTLQTYASAIKENASFDLFEVNQ